MIRKLIQSLSNTGRRVCISISKVFSSAKSEPPIDIEDPMGRALCDVEVLIAFAAQSRRNIKSEKVEKLIEAAAKVTDSRTKKQKIPPSDSAAFWNAYDALSVDMAPLSAHSIRSSIQVNAKTFPKSLGTPTAINAFVTVGVFFLCLVLQVFFVAGKELIERADTLEKDKDVLLQKIVMSESGLRRSEQKLLLATEMCSTENCDSPTSSATNKKNLQPDTNRRATLKAELSFIRADDIEKRIQRTELKDELSVISDRSRPLESLLREWHIRAVKVCGKEYMRFLCPVDIPPVDVNIENKNQMDNLKRLQDKVGLSENEYKVLLQTYSGGPSFNASQGLQTGKRMVLGRQMLSDQRALQIFEQEYAKKEADRFRSILVQVKIITANLGTYLVAMAMGVLGALTFILRSLSHQLREHTYVPVSISMGIVRICLGAIAGVFGSLLVPSSNLNLQSLPSMVVPFVFGYGIEILFSLLDKVVRSFTQVESGSHKT